MSRGPKTVAVIGLQWGDEGKGKIVDLLSGRADVVVRYQGGNNAGHTLVVDGRQTVMHLVPSGALHAQAVCVIGGGVVIDPTVLLQEVDELRARGLLAGAGSLLVSQEAHIILPYHKAIDQARERKRGKGMIGTTGRGIGPAYEDKSARTGLRMADLSRPEHFTKRLREILADKNDYLHAMLAEERLDFEAMIRELLDCGRRLAPMIVDTSSFLDAAIRAGKTVLFEGAQGALLDVDHGTYPFVTSSNTGSGAVANGAGVAPRQLRRVVGISKAYTTRVGSGPFPTELNDALGERLRKEGGEYGATTGRPRRCGWFDAMVVRKSVRLSGVDAIALTKLDVLTGIDPLRLCVGYRLAGQAIEGIPALADDYEAVEPVYEELAGWSESITAATSVEQLPAAARRYVARLEELVGVPVGILSTGPGRDQTMMLSDPFDFSS
ncbi:MAG: adenylosuccinate synthase [Deltaproteobacteria bacterium]|nr:adenylosuccinate synthase [Deltaproteobacteria bacterium]